MSNDVKLQKAVLAELNWDPSVPAGHIGVTANDGVITLSGHTESYAAKFSAEAAAERVHGVKAIAEELVVKLADGFKRDDDDIAAAAVRRLASDISVPTDSVIVKVDHGWVSLHGEVNWHFEKEAAENDVRPLAGVMGLSSHITVKPRVDVLDVRQDIRDALHRSWFFDGDTVRVSVNGGTVRLTGYVASIHDKRIAERAAWAAPGAVNVENLLEIT